MPDRVVVVGAGGFGRETLDVVEASIRSGSDIDLLGVVASEPRPVDLERLAEREISYLGPELTWLSTARGDERFIVAIGDPGIRQTVAQRFMDVGLTPISVVHPRAVVGSQSTIGDGVVIASGVQVSTNVILGDHVHLNPGSIVGHDAVLGDYVSVNPGAIVSGNVVVGAAATVGAGSVVLEGLTVEDAAFVGAGACVTKSVPAGITVVGVPARPIVRKVAK